MLYDGSMLEVAGRLLMVFFFVITGLYDLREIPYHVERIGASGVPFPAAAFRIGMAAKFGGCALLLADWHADIGIYMLMLFIVAATAIYLRFWKIEDPMRRKLIRLSFFNNVGILAGLLLLLNTLG